MSVDSNDLTNYEDYVRLELPRLVRANIEETVRREGQPLQEPLIMALMGVIEECHEKVFRSHCERGNYGTHMTD